MVVKDSSDDYWFLDEDATQNNDRPVPFCVNAETSVSLHSFAIHPDNSPYVGEYDVQPDSTDGRSEEDVGSDSPREAFRVCLLSDDFGFLADSESSDMDDGDSSDPELHEADKWWCEKCNLLNRAYYRFCEKCWNLRPGWLKTDPRCPQTVASPCKSATKRPTRPQLQSSPVKLQSADSGFASSICSIESHVPDVTSTTPESPKPSTSRLRINDTWTNGPYSPIPQSPKLRSPMSRFFSHSPLKRIADDVCVICMQKPKEASIVHGKTGHQVCCYVCAKRLRSRGQPCPVCRRPIQRVIKNFVL